MNKGVFIIIIVIIFCIHPPYNPCRRPAPNTLLFGAARRCRRVLLLLNATLVARAHRDGTKQIDANNTPANKFRAHLSPTTLGHSDDVLVGINYCRRFSFIKLSYLTKVNIVRKNSAEAGEIRIKFVHAFYSRRSIGYMFLIVIFNFNLCYLCRKKQSHFAQDVYNAIVAIVASQCV